ncbi:MAG: hypothetical protein HYV63_04205 [Candidatus Schekmanbacteria bacterium]|nr:hypothetical protein [Candidatus Schekmanbacteria bacterium]
MTASLGDVNRLLGQFDNAERNPAATLSFRSLDRFRELLRVAGSPERDTPALIVAGTNGKGSIVHMTSALLTGHGLRVGRYISPHIIDVLERICVDDWPIPAGALHRLLGELISRLGEALLLPSGQVPSYYEMMTAAAFAYFQECRVDVAVLEVGMGGRYDATNAAKRMAVGFGAMALDHVPVLGSDLRAITAEKAAIMRPSVPAFAVRQEPEALSVLRDEARQLACPFHVVGEDIAVTPEQTSGFPPRHRALFGLPAPPRVWRGRLCAPFAGRFQVENLAVSLGLAQTVLAARGAALDDAGVVQPILDGVRAAGRRQVASWRGRTVILDGAHNPAALAELVRDCDQANVRLGLLVAMMADKDFRTCMSLLCSFQAAVVEAFCAVAVASPRCAPPADLLSALRMGAATGPRAASGDPAAFIAATPADGLQRLHELISRAANIVVTGSYYLIGEILRHGRDDGLL